MPKEGVNLIYSDNINRVCGLCVHAEKRTDEEMRCTLRQKTVGISEPDCGKFEYDIFKKKVHKKRRLKTEFTAADFTLD